MLECLVRGLPYPVLSRGFRYGCGVGVVEISNSLCFGRVAFLLVLCFRLVLVTTNKVYFPSFLLRGFFRSPASFFPCLHG